MLLQTVSFMRGMFNWGYKLIIRRWINGLFRKTVSQSAFTISHFVIFFCFIFWWSSLYKVKIYMLELFFLSIDNSASWIRRLLLWQTFADGNRERCSVSVWGTHLQAVCLAALAVFSNDFKQTLTVFSTIIDLQKEFASKLAYQLTPQLIICNW